jgi:hypothetical protein
MKGVRRSTLTTQPVIPVKKDPLLAKTTLYFLRDSGAIIAASALKLR